MTKSILFLGIEKQYLHKVSFENMLSTYRVAWKFCGSFILRIGDFFCGLREQIFAVWDDWNFWWELIFAILCSSSRIFKWKKP